MWRLSGIQRDVFLQIVPKTQLWDFHAAVSLSNHYRDGELKLDVILANTKATNATAQLRNWKRRFMTARNYSCFRSLFS